MNICFVVEEYPTPQDPKMPFIRSLILQFARQSVKCTVIAPQSLTGAIVNKYPLRPVKWIDSVDNGEDITVYQPIYLTFSNAFKNAKEKNFVRAAKKAYSKIKEKQDALYGHFWHMGVSASLIDDTLPIFVASGESKISVLNRFDRNIIEKFLKRLAGTIYVSTKNYNESVELGLQRESPYVIAPNGYNPNEFYPGDKNKSREILNWSKEDFIVSFVGTFNRRKGIDRLSAAIDLVDSEKLAVCFIGKGDIVPNCKNIVFKGRVQHEQIAEYLIASDVFVLPTTNEGCCNAIVEAIACGVPVISSDLPFNDDILDNSYSIRIDPMDSEKIAKAIKELMNNKEKCEQMAIAAKEKAKELTIGSRAKRILSFIVESLDKC